jgi:hypothetical protein
MQQMATLGQLRGRRFHNNEEVEWFGLSVPKNRKKNKRVQNTERAFHFLHMSLETFGVVINIYRDNRINACIPLVGRIAVGPRQHSHFLASGLFDIHNQDFCYLLDIYVF